MTRRVAIVSGASSGMGRASAEALAARGWAVVVNFRTGAADAEAVVAACRAAGGDAVSCRGDVTEDADCRLLAETALDRWGRIDGVVNAAGTTKFAHHADLDALSKDDFLGMYAVNVVGIYQMIRASAPAMKATGSASVVNISSSAGVNGTGSSSAYACSKAAVNALTLSLARALAPEIRVNAVCPGFVEGRWVAVHLGAEHYPVHKARFEKIAPLGKTVTNEDVAEAVVWLVDGARTVTGQLIGIDSGVTLGLAPPR
ncbi:MAG: SDR family oxidoreductase [Alphaproteobacteria bacterium]|nr:SDR family oxidoreductase [Alphaproteobacteria bacterium]